MATAILVEPGLHHNHGVGTKVNSLPYAKKALGQHWLEDPVSLEAMLKAAHVSSGDTVLEIGPGTGTLTRHLEASGATVVALEFDRQRSKELAKEFSGKVVIEEGDIRSYDLTKLPKGYKIVANIPYYLTANLLRMLVDTPNKPDCAVLLVQKEVAERVSASPGQLSQVAIFTQIFYEVSLDVVVPAHLFTPPPKVDSQILVLSKREVPLFEVNDNFFTVVRAGFSEKRKKLRSSLGSGLSLPKSDIENFLLQAHVNPNSRAQELTLTDWKTLTELITPALST